VSAKDEYVVQVVASLVITFIMLGVAYFLAYFFVGQPEAQGLPWPGSLIIMLFLVVVAIVVFIMLLVVVIIVRLWFRLSGRGAGR
jgi:cation transporter-like permease